MDVDKTYFSNITKRERAIFEGAISMGALFHQFVGTPVNKSSKKSLETSMEESLKLQPAIEDVQVEIRFDKSLESISTLFLNNPRTGILSLSKSGAIILGLFLTLAS